MGARQRRGINLGLTSSEISPHVNHHIALRLWFLLNVPLRTQNLKQFEMEGAHNICISYYVIDMRNSEYRETATDEES